MEKGLEIGIERLIYVIAAFVFILVMISVTRNLLSEAEIEKDEVTFTGDKDRVIGKLTDLIEQCWDKNQDKFEGTICYKVHLNLDENLTEREITTKLNCENLPNNECGDGNCSFCESFKYDNDDKIKWRDTLEKGKSTIVIKFVPKKIVVERQTRVIN
ncbi:MAG: hypothetical protein ABEK36_01140 [Candidatus Aenigmatarchaeota archaeon]